MKSPKAPAKYSSADQDSLRVSIDDRDAENWKRREVVRPVRFEMQGDDGRFYNFTIVAGALVLTAIA